jgi:hypothetical protein
VNNYNLYFISPSTFIEFKNFIITNFAGDPKDILDGYLNKSKSLNFKFEIMSFSNITFRGSATLP